MTRKRDFKNEPLADMVAVGAVGPDRARLWMRTDRPGALVVRWWRIGEEARISEAVLEIPEGNDRDNTCSIELPSAARESEPLTPMSLYGYRVNHSSDGHLLGEGRFETAPADSAATPSSFSIALMSCHQPFTRRGSVAGEALEMLRAARLCMEEHHTRLAFLVGDQMYSDYPRRLSLFNPGYFRRIAPGRKSILDCRPQDVRRFYQRRYRHFWNQNDLKAIQAEIPCYLILDDHDIVDNWGSTPEHRRPEWRSLRTGALMACFDYQASRVLPSSSGFPHDFHYSVVYGNIAVFVMDLRSNRAAGKDGQLYSELQERDLLHFLEAQQEKEVLFIVLSVPLVHLPPADEGFSDRWSTGTHIRDRDRLLKILHAHQNRHPGQRIVLLSGDIPIGCVHQILWRDGTPPLYQVISSGITHAPGFLTQSGSALSIRRNRRIATRDDSLEADVRLLEGTNEFRKNPFARLNLGILEIETPAPKASPKVRFLLYGHRKERPFCAYRSPEIA